MKKIKFKKPFDIKEMSSKEKLMLAITLLVLLLIVLGLIRNFGKVEKKDIDYRNFDVSSIINKSDEVADNQVYWDLSKITIDFIYSYNLELKNISSDAIDYSKIKYKREDYYYALSKNYRKNISKSKYLEISKEFCKKFLQLNIKGDKLIPYSSNILKKVYKIPEYMYGDNYYLCSLYTNSNSSEAYIGIKLNQKDSFYSIFYIN